VLVVVGHSPVGAGIERVGAFVVEQALDTIAQVGRRRVVEQTLHDDVPVGEQTLEHERSVGLGINRRHLSSSGH
jgi:hypothetical protein